MKCNKSNNKQLRAKREAYEGYVNVKYVYEELQLIRFLVLECTSLFCFLYRHFCA